MGLRLTTKVQVSGWRFLLSRVEHAIVRRDTRMFDDPLRFYSRSTIIGIAISILILVGSGALAFFKPQGGDVGGDSIVADSTTHQLYVDIAGKLHPVYNLTSARLVTGSMAEPAEVGSAELAKRPKGQWVGIPGAPYSTEVSAANSSQWGLCDTVRNPDSNTPRVQIAVVAMPMTADSSVGPLNSGQALLASYEGQDWIITAEGRRAVDRADRALVSSVGIPVDAIAVPVSEAVFNALPDNGPLRLPFIPGAGLPNSIGLPPELVIGSVFQTYRPSGPVYHVVLADGIATINATTAAALRATQSYGLVELPSVEASVIVPLVERVYGSPLPAEPLELISREDMPTLCWKWERVTGDQAPETTILVGRYLPVSADYRNSGISQIQGGAMVYIDGGKYVQLQSPDPRYGEALYYIDPQGVRYGLPDVDTADSLGLTSPSTAPWEVIRLLVDGPVLSREAALLEHDTLPSDPNPRVLGTGSQ